MNVDEEMVIAEHNALVSREAALREAATLALKRLGELNRDDEAGIRMVLANALQR